MQALQSQSFLSSDSTAMDELHDFLPRRRQGAEALERSDSIPGAILAAVLIQGATWRWQRWDHMEIPRLFTRVYLVVVVGDVLNVPPGLTKDEVAPWACRLHDALEAVERRYQENS